MRNNDPYVGIVGHRYPLMESRVLLQDRITRLSVILSMLIFLVYLLTIAFSIRSLPPLIPLFNSLPWGQERLAPSYMILIFPFLFIIIFFINNFYAGKIYLRHTLVARILSFNSFLVIFLGLLAYIQILLLVF